MDCYFFGTFNPVHNGHIKTAVDVVDCFGFDKMIFVPAYMPPHKICPTPFSDRLNMLKLISNSKIEVLDIEQKLPTPSYSYQTVAAILRQTSKKKLNFIIGFDAFREIESWKRTEFLKEHLIFIVLRRKGSKREEIEQLEKKGFDFVICDTIDLVNISSTEIRKKVELGASIDGLVDEKVKRYINENRLYKRNA